MKEGISHMAREADTYRGARRNQERGIRKSLFWKAERLALGISRREMDRQREEERKKIETSA
jgi:hypothetical protein